MRRLLSALTQSVSFHRNRATYYQTRKGLMPAFVRRFLLRHPQTPLWIVFALLSSAMVGPSMISVYYYITLSPEEFDRYKEERMFLVRERAKYGKHLWIPFYSKGTLDEDDKPKQIA
uniref:NADH-ubiquinone oxidoreductase B15 subunit n=1 Tax=Haemonchus contortus TaxID=6289 RepID=A0A7I4YFB5_HAECO